MDIRQAAQVIRDTVETEDIVRLYGYNPKHGFMICPFHGDTDASLKVYRGTGGWHCYGCGRGGSVIDFVMEHESCSFPTAVRSIDNAMRLHLMDPYENPFDAEDRKRVQEWLDDFVGAVYAYCDALEKTISVQITIDMEKMKQIRDKNVCERTADECTFLLNWEGETQYNEHRIEQINQFREEVATWRREARRVKSA